MSSKVKMLILVAVLLAVGAGLVFWKSKVGGSHGDALTNVTKEQMEMLVKDLNPMQQRMLAENPEQKKELAKNLQEFLAIANQARKEGFAEKPEVKQELKYMEKAILALSYDKEKNKDKPMPPLSMITEAQIAEFWGEDPSATDEKDAGKKEGEEPKPAPEIGENAPKQGEDPVADEKDEKKADAPSAEDPGKKDDPKPNQLVIAEEGGKGFWEWIGLGDRIAKSKANRREAEFDEFLKAQEKLEQGRGQRAPGQKMSPEQLKQMRDSFARFSIYAEEAEGKMDELGKEFREKVEFQTKLQQSQLLAQLYAREKLVPKLEVTEEEVTKYIDEHPELVKEKKDKADEILKKAKDGEDFEKLAKEFSEDPGSKEKGGLYEKVPKGQMIPAFEKAALALEEGQIAPNLVRTKFGYHIIKLVKKGDSEERGGQKVETYDARHILISTTVKDKDNPMQQEVPLDDFVTNKLKKERQDEILAEILKNNPIEIATDFEVTPPPVPQQPQLPPGMQLPEQGPPPAPAGDDQPKEAPKPEGDAKADKK